MQQEQQTKEIEVLKTQDLTKKSSFGKVEDPKYWDKKYINRMIESVNNHQHKMLLIFLWYSGVRITEAVSLRKQDIDFVNYVMQVRWLKSRKYKQRTLPIHPELKSLLQLYTATFKAEDRVFPITRQRAWQLTKKYLNGHPHQLRHSFAVNWLRCGGDIVTLYRILGHSKIQTTMEYLKIVPVDQGKELIKIIFK